MGIDWNVRKDSDAGSSVGRTKFSFGKCLVSGARSPDEVPARGQAPTRLDGFGRLWSTRGGLRNPYFHRAWTALDGLDDLFLLAREEHAM